MPGVGVALALILALLANPQLVSIGPRADTLTGGPIQYLGPAVLDDGKVLEIFRQQVIDA